MKELWLVCLGSFFGGGARYLVSKAVQSCLAVSFPWGTMAVNVVGCFLIGLLSGLSLGGQMSPTTKLVLVTGFCGGFTTFSTFMNENLLLGRDGAVLSAVLYTFASLALGLVAVLIGYQIVK
jgi:CrcB protein